jgi:hypothetical protein
MPGPALLGPSAIVLSGLAVVLAVVAYRKDPGLPWMRARTGLALVTGRPFVAVRVVPSLAFPFFAGRRVTLCSHA